jgi:hypothetical protein
MISGVRGRIGIAGLIALVMLAGSLNASASRSGRGRCAVTGHARVVARTPQLLVSSVPHRQVVDAVPVTNATYFTCLLRTGEQNEMFAASSDPSPDAGYQSYLGAIRAAGHFVLYVSAFVQDNPGAPTTQTAMLHVVDAAEDDRQTLAVRDPNIGLIPLGDVALSVAGYMAWAQLSTSFGATTETVEADTGSGPITLASAPLPATLTPLAFHKLSFHGETLTWLSDGRRQSAPLSPYALAPVRRRRFNYGVRLRATGRGSVAPAGTYSVPSGATRMLVLPRGTGMFGPGQAVWVPAPQMPSRKYERCSVSRLYALMCWLIQ